MQYKLSLLRQKVLIMQILEDNAQVFYLIEITTKENRIFRYQNYRDEEIYWEGSAYSALPMQIQLSNSTLELENISGEIIIPNNEITRAFLYIYIEPKQTYVNIVAIHETQNAFHKSTGLIQRVVVEDTLIRIEIQSPISPVSGQIPSKFFSRADFPHVPLNLRVSLR